ncbi:hypothetical protein ADU59_28910 [Pararhizobium polonicum]|uniref:Uncharacterized protein n=1 Tax=Pararhizobium polonicum TaxID=1612624 RepID=A0A1C7NTH9_9HYPH|nr:hypothetical protein [Pararhizobium polonicum]OBZ92016.1 hypothetical protein ADU59_28910 [Pararhizobium polonicum]
MRDPLLERVQSALATAWSIETSSKWRPENPALGQCGVTALVVQDLLGGDILKTRFGDAWHFYNRIGGARLDFSALQFSSPVAYSDLDSGRDEALADTSPEQYRILRERLLKDLGADNAPGGFACFRMNDLRRTT